MKEPEVDKTLISFSGTLLTKIMPHLKSEYAQKDLTLIALALNGAAEEYDRAAENRMAEFRATREVLKAGLALMEDGDLKRSIAEAVAMDPASLRIRDLNAANDKLAAALIQLQAFVEEQEGAAWRGFEKRIWDELEARTKRRAISFFPF